MCMFVILSPLRSCVSCPQQEGTVKPHPAFDAEIDAQTLRTAMKGLGGCKGIDISGLVS